MNVNHLVEIRTHARTANTSEPIVLFFKSLTNQIVAGINPINPPKIQIGLTAKPIKRVMEEVIKSMRLKTDVLMKVDYLPFQAIALDHGE